MAVILSLPVLIGLIAVALALIFLTACMTARTRLRAATALCGDMGSVLQLHSVPAFRCARGADRWHRHCGRVDTTVASLVSLTVASLLASQRLARDASRMREGLLQGLLRCFSQGHGVALSFACFAC